MDLNTFPDSKKHKTKRNHKNGNRRNDAYIYSGLYY